MTHGSRLWPCRRKTAQFLPPACRYCAVAFLPISYKRPTRRGHVSVLTMYHRLRRRWRCTWQKAPGFARDISAKDEIATETNALSLSPISFHFTFLHFSKCLRSSFSSRAVYSSYIRHLYSFKFCTDRYLIFFYSYYFDYISNFFPSYFLSYIFPRCLHSSFSSRAVYLSVYVIFSHLNFALMDI